ncbi:MULTISPECIES: hypothetical protein [unclassified Beijerinckia]|uniref:DUF7227 family protein n=1 Tax=unclassified Beijerinckia TaxID=2638183 RepID=UPI000894FC22|nr:MULTISPECIES: hypothetical protein [unclassified Beijerinckia]MDH7796367.1 hypothetical protein [Beijerinckia sp. GAS462]SEC42100.1 hypothetical protein SAMN05443249_2650 [Beijerinckia sp. 28-YEA-48]
MANFVMTAVSRNKKTGPIPVVTSSRDTCPTSCAFLNNGCYAEHGPLRLHWDKVSNGEAVNLLSFDQLLAAIRKLPRDQVWRYGQAGDLPNNHDQIRALAKANGGRKAIVYTHHRFYGVFNEIRSLGFNVNLSANDINEADELVKTGLPVVTVVDESFSKRPDESLRAFRDRIGGRLSFGTPGGNRVALCPASYLDTNCMLCRACAFPRAGGTIIGFPAHGTRKRRLSEKLSMSGELRVWERRRLPVENYSSA